jgi:hypothetical protein
MEVWLESAGRIPEQAADDISQLWGEAKHMLLKDLSLCTLWAMPDLIMS